MKIVPRLAVVLFLLFACVGCDQATKTIATEVLSPSPPLSFMNDLFRLQYAENAGAMLSLGANLPVNVRFFLFTVIAVVLLTGLLLFTLASRNLSRARVIALSIIMGGGFSNLLDRLFHEGVVIDFMNIGVGPIRTGIFNMADVAITLGMGILVYVGIQSQRGRRPVL